MFRPPLFFINWPSYLNYKMLPCKFPVLYFLCSFYCQFPRCSSHSFVLGQDFRHSCLPIGTQWRDHGGYGAQMLPTSSPGGARDFFKINGKIIAGGIVTIFKDVGSMAKNLSLMPHFYSPGHALSWYLTLASLYVLIFYLH